MADVTATLLRAHARAGANVSDAELQACVDTANVLLTQYVDGLEVEVLIYNRAWLLVANELLQQNLAPNGILNQQYDGDGSVPLRIGRDPLTPAYPLLTPLGFA